MCFFAHSPDFPGYDPAGSGGKPASPVLNGTLAVKSLFIGISGLVCSKITAHSPHKVTVKVLSLSSACLIATTGLLGCSGKTTLDEAPISGTDSDSVSEDSGDDTAEDSGIDAESRLDGTISGTVRVQLYTTGADGEREELSWEDGTGGSFPFGSIYVAAYYDDEDGAQRYVGDTVISSPSIEGNAYTIEASMDGGEAGQRDVYVYAVLDYYADSIIGNNEPTGTHPSAVSFVADTEAEGVDVTILSSTYSTDTSTCSTLTISGDATITQTYIDGDVAVLLMDTAGNGPYHSARLYPEEDGGGASGDYALSSCVGYGEMVLMGVWDKTGNGMFDPRDRWGAYIAEPDVDGNPISVGSQDMTGYDVQIPLGSSGGISLLPFVRLTGTVALQGGDLSDLPEGATVYVAALKYRPDGQLSVSELEDAYDYDVFTEPSGSALEWGLTTPADTIVYLWAYVDLDGDGIVNESGEYVASGGEDDNGKLPTGSSGANNIDMNLATAEN